MPGSPRKRERLRRIAAGEIIPVRPPGWASMTDAEKLMFALRANIENIADLVAVPFDQATDHEKSLQVRVYETHLRVARDMLSDGDRRAAQDETTKRLRQLMENGQQQ